MDAELLRTQSAWLAEARARLLRLASIATRKRVLDLGCGYGHVLPELKRRAGGSVIALDQSLKALSSLVEKTAAVCGQAQHLPFADGVFDLVFSQNVLLWSSDDAAQITNNVHRILQTNGAWVLIEPDFGGMIEYPPEIETRTIWMESLQRAGADPCIARKLPMLLNNAGFRAKVELLASLFAPQIERFDFLAELPLTTEQQSALERIRKATSHLKPEQQVAHLPYFLIIAERSAVSRIGSTPEK